MNLARIRAGEIVPPTEKIVCGDFSCATPSDDWTLGGTASFGTGNVIFGAGGTAEQDIGSVAAGGELNGYIVVNADINGIILQVQAVGSVSGTKLINSGIFGAGQTTLNLNNFALSDNEDVTIKVTGAAGGVATLGEVSVEYSAEALNDLDLFPDFAITADFSHYSTDSLGSLKMPISNNVSVPFTDNNASILGVSKDGSLKPVDLDCKVLVDNEAVYRFRLKVNSAVTLGLNERIEITLIDPLKYAVEQLKEMTLSDLVTDGEYDFYLNAAAIAARNSSSDDFIKMVYQDFNGFGEDDPRLMIFRPETDFDSKDGVQQLVPALKIKEIFSRAFGLMDIGYYSKFFEGTSEIESYPVDDLYMMAPVRFFLDKDKDKPTGGTWSTEREDTVSYNAWSARPYVFGFTEWYSPTNPNGPHPLAMNYTYTNSMVAIGQWPLFDTSTLNSQSGVGFTNQMIFKKPSRYSVSMTQTVYPKISLIRNNGPAGGYGAVAIPSTISNAQGVVGIYFVASVEGGLKQVKVGEVDFADAGSPNSDGEYVFPPTNISIPSSFYLDIDTGNTVEFYITMQSEEATLDFVSGAGITYTGVNLNEFQSSTGAQGTHALLFGLGSSTPALYKAVPNLVGGVVSAPVASLKPVYDITFSPYEAFPVSPYSGGEQLDFKFNLERVTEKSLYDILVDIAKRFNMSFVYDFANHRIVVDNLLEEYIKPSTTENIVARFDNGSDLTQNFISSGIKRIKLLNASGRSITDEYVTPDSVFANENDVVGFGDLNLSIDETGDREESFQSIMLLANGSIYGDAVDWYSDEIFKERVKYGVPSNTNLKCGEMGLRIGFLNGEKTASLYEPIYEVVDNMVRMEYKLIDPTTSSAVMPILREYSAPVLVDGDIETYSLRWDDATDTFRGYYLFWRDFVNKVNDLPSVECTLVVNKDDLAVLDFKRKYDFGIGDCILVSTSGFDFTLDNTKVKAKFLLY